MSDVYWREYGIAAKQRMNLMRQNAEDAQRIINELVDERNEAQKKADVWQAHYIGLNARAGFLLEELDKAHGGALYNPVRMHASEDITLPNGYRKGQPINFSERVYLVAMNKFIKENMSYLGNWKVVKKWNIFGLGTLSWREDVQETLDIYEHYAQDYAERVEQELQSRRDAQEDHQEQPDSTAQSDQIVVEKLAHVDPVEKGKPSE